jgi:hypothetical protein
MYVQCDEEEDEEEEDWLCRRYCGSAVKVRCYDDTHNSIEPRIACVDPVRSILRIMHMLRVWKGLEMID